MTRVRKGCPTKRSKPVGDWQERAIRTIEAPYAAEPSMIVVEQADMIDTVTNHRYSGGSYRVRLKNVPDMRTKTFVGESAWSSAARYAADAATKCGDWRWWPDL